MNHLVDRIDPKTHYRTGKHTFYLTTIWNQADLVKPKLDVRCHNIYIISLYIYMCVFLRFYDSRQS